MNKPQAFFSRQVTLPVLVILSFSGAYAQTPPASGQCATSSVPTLARAEGLTERMGDIILQCSGANAGSVFSGNLTVFLPVTIANRVNSSNLTQDATLSVDYGGGPVSTGIPGLINNRGISFNGFSATAPASGNVTFRISGIRADLHQLGAGPMLQPIVASLSVPFPVNQTQLIVAYPQTGLYINSNNTSVTCTGSTLPSSIGVASLFARTPFASTRMTEGFPGAFADAGTRFLIAYSGFPADARLFVPDLVAGSDAAVPTAGGDLGGAQSGGRYLPGSRTLLLARVPDADATGADGAPVAIPTGSTAVALDAASEVALSSGAGYAVYEVVDSNPAVTETAQFPTFFGIPANSAVVQTSLSVRYAPVSDVGSASATAPVPRFAPVTPASDCSVMGDCGASYFPKLATDAAPILFTAVAGGKPTSAATVKVWNEGGGVMSWASSIAYQNGSGWLYLQETRISIASNVRVMYKPDGLAPGTYKAGVIVDAGPYAGSVTVPVTLTVEPAPAAPATPAPAPTAQPAVAITKVVNAATFEGTPLVAGSLGTLFGTGLAGKDVSVTFGGAPAIVLYAGAGQINFQVPPGIGSTGSANIAVTVDGSASAPVAVTLAPAGPSVFAHGVLNQDNTPNGPQAGAGAGSVLQIFATGIPAGAPVSVQIADRKDLVPAYAGDAPGLTGIQQVNVAVPEGLAAGSVPLVLCATAGQQQYCSAGYALLVK